MIVSSLVCMLFVMNAQASMSVEDLISPALNAAGLTTGSTRFDAGMMSLFRSAEFTTPLYEAASENPWKAPFLFNVFTNDLEAQAGKPNEILSIGAHYVGNGSRRTLIGDPLAALRATAEKPADFLSAVRSILPPPQDKSGMVARVIDTNSKSVPQEVKDAAVLVIRAARQSHEQYKLFLRSVFGTDTPSQAQMDEAQKVVAAALKDDAPSVDFAPGLDIFHAADTRYLIAGANDLLMAVQDASKMVANVPPTARYEFEVWTDWGELCLSGGSDSVYKSAPRPALSNYFLVIDTGGNDTYINVPCAEGGTGSGSSWASIVIDTTGNDKYLSDPALATQALASWPGRKDTGMTPGPAGAFMGYSFLFDLKGDDIYRSARCGLGSGRLGVAVLEDAGGNDVYDGYADSLGFGMFGEGILEDMGGNDTYNGFTQVEGVGQTAGFGALIDHGGNDVYVANDSVIDFPSAQSDKHNDSMSQGAGNGTRRDYLDAHQLAGGIGLLLDTAGDDKYSGAVFAQGVGYLEGIGILRDKAGADTYNGGWYVQGASAHFAIGYLQDDQGDDHYAATMNMAQGAGHDFGAGYLIDLAGNDTYLAPNLSLGAGNANGIGLFLDAAGDDSYTTSGITLGEAGDSPKGSLRERALCLGVFVDLGGNDTYPAALPWAKNGKTEVNWTGKARVPEESQLGVFYDRG